MNLDVLIVSPTFNFGGAEKVSINVANLLYANNIKVEMLLLDTSGPLRTLLNPEIRISSTVNPSARKAIGDIKRIIAKKKPKVVFSNTSRMNFAVLVTKLFNRSQDIKFVCREPNNPYKTHKSTNFLLRAAYRFLFSKAGFVIAQNKQMNSDIVSFYKICKTNVKTLHNPVSVNLSSDSLVQKESYFIFVGRFTEQKNIPGLLEAFKIASVENRIESKLYLFGSGDMENYITDFTKANNLTDKVFIFPPRVDIHDYIAGAKALLLPSNWEGSPNVVLEALKCGTPSIVSPILEQYEQLINQSAYGCIIKSKPNDARFTSDLASSISEYAQKKKEIFIWNNSTESEYLEFFKTIIE